MQQKENLLNSTPKIKSNEDKNLFQQKIQFFQRKANMDNTSQNLNDNKNIIKPCLITKKNNIFEEKMDSSSQVNTRSLDMVADFPLDNHKMKKDKHSDDKCENLSEFSRLSDFTNIKSEYYYRRTTIVISKQVRMSRVVGILNK